jgi:hypothetical protein
MLVWLDQPPTEVSPLFDAEQVKHKLGWITRFRPQLEEWEKMFEPGTSQRASAGQ